MKMIFDGIIIEDSFLRDVRVIPSAEQDKFDVVAKNRGETRILKTFDTEEAATAWVNELGDKLVAEKGIATLDMRG